MLIQLFTGLRGKMLLIVAIGMLLIFALIYFAAHVVLLESYTQLEEENALIQVSSAASLLKEQSLQLDNANTDYAHWDLMYQYAIDHNEEFTSSSVNNGTFVSLKINALFIIDSSGKTLNEKPIAIADSLIRATSLGGLMLDIKRKNTSGLLSTPEGIYIVSSVGISNTAVNKPSNGTIIMARLLDSSVLLHLNQILKTEVSLDPIQAKKLAEIAPELAKDGVAVKPLNDMQIAGFVALDDIGGNNKLILSTIGDRKIYQQGKASLNFIIWSLGLIGLILAVFSWLFDKLLLKRLQRLNSNVKKIGESTARNSRLEEQDGDDEINNLAHGINGMLHRIDESQQALEFEKERAEITLAGIADAVITSNNKGELTYMNAAAEQLSGMTLTEVNGKPLQNIFYLMSVDESISIESSWLTDLVNSVDEVSLKRADGQTFVLTKSASPLYDKDMMLYSTVTVLHDVSILRKLSTQISYQARHDQLTGLVNRYEFERRLQEAIDDSATEGSINCLAYFDLDRFKIVNDTSGHNAGDILLQQLASLLKQKVRSTDTLARLGGDEFALLLNGCDIDKAYQIIENLLQVVQDYRFTAEDKIYTIGASFGLTKISINETLTLSELFSTVDSACYAAKNAGGNRIHVYNYNDDTLKLRTSQQNWVARIQMALEKNQFVLYAQTFKGLTAHTEAHCELLIRLHGNDDKLHPPSAFLPAAERYRLMPQIDRWVINEALSIMARKGNAFKTVCAINLSGQSLSDEGLLKYIINKINYFNIKPDRLCFEITETAVISNIEQARKLMRDLRALGCRFSLDDFGSGMSSFAYLKNLEVDFLKIDGMFIQTLANNPINRAMAESINHIGHVMGLQTIAEFVETDEIIAELKKMGVDYAQGYGVAMPEPFE
jgi:diguanylate cyclase (GGDEF)-like protein/PAS domain S-box-containing protein